MNRYIYISLGIIGFFLIFYIIFSFGEAPSRDNLFGVWEGEYNGKKYKFKFNNDNSFVLSLMDIPSSVTEILKGEYEVDFSKRTIPLTLKSISKLNHPLYTIIEFLDKDTIRLADFAPRWKIRPISFNYHEIIYLNREN